VKPLYLLLGWLFFALGATGVVIPGLPTVPFMLVALWAFSRSSARFHDWLYTHRLFGPPLQQWRDHRVIPVKAKVLAVVTMTASLAYMVFIADVSTWVMAVTALVMVPAAAYRLSQPSQATEVATVDMPVPVSGEDRFGS
jgi:uncharacterized membrane protein YbaN (DUF454 family)